MTGRNFSNWCRGRLDFSARLIETVFIEAFMLACLVFSALVVVLWMPLVTLVSDLRDNVKATATGLRDITRDFRRERRAILRDFNSK